MENKNNKTDKLVLKRALYIYLGVCVFLVVLILFNSFSQSGGGGLQGKLYIRPNIILSSGQ